MEQPTSGDAPVSDTAMDTGSDAGTPAERFPDEPLGPEDRAVLAELARPSPAVVPEPVEESPAAADAADDDSPLPAATRPGERESDPDTPRFLEPPL